MTIAMEPIRVSLNDAARFLGCGPRKFQHLVSTGKIEFVTDTPNGTRYYIVDDLRKYLASLKKQTVTK